MNRLDEHHNDNATSTKRSMTVSELNRKVKDLLEVHLPLIWVEGEISNFSRPSSGHWYFTLKDENAQIRCAMFRGRNSLIKFKPSNGDHLRLRARVSLYEGRGDYQLIVEHAEDVGFGLLQKRYDELKLKLENEGLFDQAFKKPLPKHPKHIGLITSTSGAAVRDVLHVLQRRSPNIPVAIFPASVQGEQAPEQIIQALRLADEFEKCDVLIICRGGGSLEDLWAFNNEALARTIFAADIPIISAIGHEIDFTICDFVADLRAPTPSAAAEVVSPDVAEKLAQFQQIERRLAHLIQNILHNKFDKLNSVKSHLKHPGTRLTQGYQRLDELESRMRRATQNKLYGYQHEIKNHHLRLQQQTPHKRIAHEQKRLDNNKQLLMRIMTNQLSMHRLHFEKNVNALDIVSPLATLKRGYTIAKTEKNTIIKSAYTAKQEPTLTLQFHDGDVSVHVK